MTLTELVAQYGYLAVFAGAFLEGETVLILAGFAAHQGYLSFFWVVALAMCAGTLGDQTCFFLGRRSIVPSAQSGMPLWQDKIFIFLMKNAANPTDFYKIPPGRVVELGTQAELLQHEGLYAQLHHMQFHTAASAAQR